MAILDASGQPFKKARKRWEGESREQPAAEGATGSAGTLASPIVAFLKDEIDAFERIFDKFQRRGRKILKKYRDVRTPREDAVTRYNILWANVQTRLPALYARNPKVVVERRFKDRDPIGRTASEILERSIEYTLDHCNDLFYTMRHVVKDYELPGRGSVWVRYEPHFHKRELDAAKAEGEPKEKANHEIDAQGASITNATKDEVQEEVLSYEETLIDYVNWEDFGHSWGRVWEEVRLVWRKVYLSRTELKTRFTELSDAEILSIPLDWSPKNLTDTQIRITRKKAIVYEIWDKEKRCRYWLVKNFPKLLDERDDDLGLESFFPTPRPLIANELSDELLPTPNFTYYQDQANEIDELSTRIVSITKALKVAGVRDASAEGLDRLLSEGVENALVPVQGWQALKDKGGIAGVMDLLPMKEIAETLMSLREQRQQLIEDVYQLTGIADIVRGFSDPDETATAQQMKGQFSMIRIEDAQREVQRFARDVVRLVGEIVSDYDIETLKAISGVKLLTNDEKQQLQLQIALQQAQAAAAHAQAPPQPGAPGGPPQAQGPAAGPAAPTGQGANPGQMSPAAAPAPSTPAPGAPPVSPDKMKLLELPTWEEVGALLENPVEREFRIDIETDSTSLVDDEQERKQRVELITAVGEYLDKMIQGGMEAPPLIPFLGELMMYGVRAFKGGRPLEQAMEDAIESMQKQAQGPKPPDPETMKAIIQGKTQMQIAQQKAQLDMQVEQAKQAAQAREDQVEQQLEQARKSHDMQLQAQLEQHKAALQAHTDLQVQDMKNRFEAERVQFEGAVKLQIAAMEQQGKREDKHLELQHQSAEGEKQRAHEAGMGHLQAGHAKDLEETKGKHQEKVTRIHATKGGDEPDHRVEGLKEVSRNLATAVQHLSRPRKVKRGADGSIEGIE